MSAIILSLMLAGKPLQATYLTDSQAWTTYPETAVSDIGCLALIAQGVPDSVFSDTECMEY